MDPAIANAAVALLSPYLSKAAGGAASEAGKAAWKAGESLYEAIRKQFGTKPDAHTDQTLQRLQEQPTNKERQAALARMLIEHAHSDHAFARELEQLVEHAKQDDRVDLFMTQVYGNAWVKSITNIHTVQTDRFEIH
jgi:hypothetical protein